MARPTSPDKYRTTHGTVAGPPASSGFFFMEPNNKSQRILRITCRFIFDPIGSFLNSVSFFSSLNKKIKNGLARPPQIFSRPPTEMFRVQTRQPNHCPQIAHALLHPDAQGAEQNLVHLFHHHEVPHHIAQLWLLNGIEEPRVARLGAATRLNRLLKLTLPEERHIFRLVNNFYSYLTPTNLFVNLTLLTTLQKACRVSVICNTPSNIYQKTRSKFVLN